MQAEKTSIQRLSDGDIEQTVRGLAQDLRATESELLVYLAEVDRRQLYAKAGYSSLFAFCTGDLLFSEGTACRRIASARVLNKFPAALEYLTSGKLHTTALAMLEKHLTTSNHAQVLARAAGKTKRELEWLIAELAPRADVVGSICTLPNREANEAKPVAGGQPVMLDLAASAGDGIPAQPFTSEPAPARPATKPLASSVVPLSPQRILVKFSAPKAFETKIAKARDLLAHKLPGGDLEDVFDAALEALLDRLDPVRKAARRTKRQERGAAVGAPAAAAQPGAASAAGDTGAPHPPACSVAQNTSAPVAKRSRYIPAEDRHTVWQEADGRCTFVSSNGKRCMETLRLELDHCEPWALGGDNRSDNLHLYCRTHNAYSARQTFGPEQPWLRRHGGGDMPG